MRIRNQSPLEYLRRRGLAPLEFVAVLPFLVLMTIVIYRLGMGYVHKIHANIEARQEASKPKTDLVAEAAPLPDLSTLKLKIGVTGKTGLVDETADLPVNIKPLSSSPARLPVRLAEAAFRKRFPSRGVFNLRLSICIRPSGVL